MTLPDLRRAADARLHALAQPLETLRSAAHAAGLRVLDVDLGSIASKTALMETLGSALKLPAHFGRNWDALADVLQDEQWLGDNGMVAVLRNSSAYSKAHPTDWKMLSDIFEESIEYWKTRHKPLWIFLA
jgi:RNAse (barnase) inhibitor barstar